MFRMIAVLAVGGFFIGAPTLAQDEITSRPSIVVVGLGRAEQTPEIFRMSADLQGRGATQVDAFRELANVQKRVRDGLANLNGLTNVEVTTGQASVSAVPDPQCVGDRYDTEGLDCPATGYLAAVSVVAQGSPVDRAGDAVSLAAQLGARNSSMTSTKLVDESQVRAEANRAAFADARRQALALADAADQRIVRVLRVQDPTAESYRTDVSAGHLGDVVVVGARPQLEVPLEVAPPPVVHTSRLTVVFEIE